MASSAYVVVGDADALLARASAGGARVLSEPTDTDYGSREFTVRDPEGTSGRSGLIAAGLVEPQMTITRPLA